MYSPKHALAPYGPVLRRAFQAALDRELKLQYLLNGEQPLTARFATSTVKDQLLIKPRCQLYNLIFALRTTILGCYFDDPAEDAPYDYYAMQYPVQIYSQPLREGARPHDYGF